jgi:peptidoglycan hydrolase-like protein with peptidoglycan-binding domain
MQALPLVAEGSTDVNAVRTVQGLLCARGHAVTVDGDFGAATRAALEAFQRAHGLTADGQCGPASWPRLMGV